MSLAYGYDGSLVTSTTWAGNVAGSVGWTYNNDFRVVSESVNGANSVTAANELVGFDPAPMIGKVLHVQLVVDGVPQVIEADEGRPLDIPVGAGPAKGRSRETVKQFLCIAAGRIDELEDRAPRTDRERLPVLASAFALGAKRTKGDCR